jgi:hypothetical protein
VAAIGGRGRPEPLAEVRRQLEQDPIGSAWPADTRRRYLDFCRHLMRADPLAVKTGAGGLSFYKALDGRKIFVCHFNASPRRGQAGLGFADFRRDALQDCLDVDRALRALRRALGEEIEVKAGKTWCGLHFPLRQSTRVADAFREHIVSPAGKTRPASHG